MGMGHRSTVIRYDCDSILGMNHIWGNEVFSPARSKSRHNSGHKGEEERKYQLSKEKEVRGKTKGEKRLFEKVVITLDN